MPSEHFDQHDVFMKLFLQSERTLLRYVMCLVPNVHDAREVVQNTAVALWKKFDQYDSEQPFVNWACRFALIEAKEFLRSEQRWTRFLDDTTINELLCQRDAMLDELDGRRLHLRSCLRKLSPKQLGTVEAYYFEDRPIEQIAKSSRRTVDAIYKSLQRIRVQLRHCVDRHMQAAEAT